MVRKWFEQICRVVAVAGFLFALGAAGASDIGALTFWQVILRLAVGGVLFAGGAYFGGLLK